MQGLIRWCSTCKGMRPHHFTIGSEKETYCMVCSGEMKPDAPQAQVGPLDEEYLKSVGFAAMEIARLKFLRHRYRAGEIPGDDYVRAEDR